MKKILFALLLSLFFIPGVNAVEISCSTTANLLKPNNFIDGRFIPNETSPTNIGYYDIGYNGLIPVQPNTSYRFKTYFNSSDISPRRIAVEYYDKDFNYISYFNEKVTANEFGRTFTTDSNTYYITIHIYKLTVEQLNNNNYQLSVSENFSWVEYEECPIVEPEPEEPEIPIEPSDPIEPDTTLYNFYNIYISKLQLLFQYATENKFILGFVGIVLLFTILELILNLFRKGGYR